MYIIYVHTCLVNGKQYVGLTSKTLEQRWQEHCKTARRGGLFFHRAISAYGEENWQHEIVASCETYEDACELEKKFIAERRTFEPEFGYNLTLGGEGSKGHTHQHTPEAIEKIRTAGTGRVFNVATREKISQANKGRIRTPEQRAQMSQARRGKKLSVETREKMSQAQLGKRHSEETKRKIGQAHKGRKHTETSRLNMSLAHMGLLQSEATVQKRILSLRGHVVSAETREKIGSKNRGRKMSDEARQKMSERAKERWRRHRELRV